MTEAVEGRGSDHIAHLSTHADGALRVGRLFGFDVFLTWRAVAFYGGLAVAVWWYLPRFHPEVLENLSVEQQVFLWLSFLPAIVLHELGHAFVAKALGQPVRHIQIAWLSGYTLVSRHSQSASVDFLITAAGPAATAMIAGGCWLAATRLDVSQATYDLLILLAWVNLAGVGINLLPVLPNDGGKLLDATLRGFGVAPPTAIQVTIGLGRLITVVASLAVGYVLVQAGYQFFGFLAGGNGLYLALTAQADTTGFDLRNNLAGVPVSELSQAARLVPSSMPLATLIERRLDAQLGKGMSDTKMHRAPYVVTSQGEPIGVVSAEDLQWAAHNRSRVRGATAAQLLTPFDEYGWVPPEADAIEAWIAMVERKRPYLVVLDDVGNAGIVSWDRMQEAAEEIERGEWDEAS